MKRTVLASLLALSLVTLLGSCGGGGGGGGDGGPPPVAEVTGVFTGYADGGNLDWENPGGAGDGDGGVGVGAGSDGDGGVGAGGDLGQFLGANVCVFLDSGTQLGCALTDTVKGMVTIKPGRSYTGGLRIELRGTATATYYEEGRNTYVPFPPERLLRVRVPAIARNIGITPFTEAAFRLLSEGNTPESVGNATPTRAQIRAANERVRQALNEHFPTALQVDDIARLPFIKSQGLAAGSMKTDPRGRYGLVNGAFSKQASFHHSDSAAPTLDAVRQLSEDLLDGRIDGRNGSQLAGVAASRTYDPQTFTGELSSALAEQAARFGAQEALDVLPKVVNYGNVRYEGYLFDGAISKSGGATSTVTGWVADNSRNFNTGQQFNRLPGQRALGLFSNNGHGGGFYKADANGPRHKVYAIGDNVNGELGLGTRASTNAQAVEVSLPGSPSHIVGGFAHTLARMADGTVWAWGDNSYGQLGRSPAGLPNSLTPLQVSLPVPAVAVAAASVASYALGADGKVYAWGSNGGFALLGSGSADGIVPLPAALAGLSDIVQISARDNDVVVLRRDHTVWHWGSHPADSNAFVAGDPSAPYSGGTRTPVQVAGLPAGQAVRKVITEQGLFAVLLANGHVYTWGVHFDITAGDVLRGPSQLIATRMLGLPPIRDMMPGGFQGYGQRAFDRLTAMGVDYAGGMWKIRGRVGEVFDPDTEASRSAQRRPQGQGPRKDCEACHTFLDQPLVQLKAASRQPTTGTECVPPISVHRSATASLIHAETDCVSCHNPARLNHPITTPSGSQPFAANNGWPDCVKPAALPNRTATPPAIISNACEIPPRHVFTPPGTVCASCHNSVLARPLRETPAACAQPLSSQLPTIPTTATLAGAFTAGGAPIAAGSLSPARQHELRGSLSAALVAGQSLSIERNGAAIGTAVVSGTNWSFAVAAAPDGTNSYRTRVTAGAGFGAYSNVLSFTVDGTPPSALAVPTSFTDEVLGTIAIGGFASDTTPQINGSLSATLGAGESVQVLRDGSVIGSAAVSAQAWSFAEAAALPAGTYAYQSRAVDSAGNLGTLSSIASLSIVTSLPSVSITQVLNDAVTPAVALSSGSSTADRTPVFSGTLSAALPAGHVLRLYRGSTALGAAASVSGQTWSYTEPGASDGSHSYSARVEAGAVVGASSAAFALTIDTAPPTQVANVTVIADDANGDLTPPVNTADQTPIIKGTLSAALASGEQVQVLRGATVVGSAAVTGSSWTFTEPPPGVTVPPGSTSVTVTYAARVIDAAGLTGPATGSTIAVTVTPGSAPLLNAAATIATVNGRVPTVPLEVSYLTAPTLGITLERALLANEVLNLYRNTSTPVVSPPPCGVGTAALAATRTSAQLGTATSVSVATGAVAASSQPYAYIARIEQVGNTAVCGASNNTASALVVAPLVANATAAVDANGQSIAGGNTSLAATVSGTLSAALRTGETLQIRRTLSGGATVSLVPTSVSGTTWTYTEPATPAVGSYSYAARTLDSVLTAGTTGATVTVNVIAALPAVATQQVSGASNGFVNTATPTLTGTLAAALPSGATVRIYRASGSNSCGTLGSAGCPAVGSAGSAGSTVWSFTDSDVGQGVRRYRSRVENGTAYGAASAELAVTVDSVAPTQTFGALSATTSVMPNTTVNAQNGNPAANPNGDAIASGGRSNDNSPTLRIPLNAALGIGETLRIKRNGVTVISSTLGSSCGSNCFLVEVPASVSLVNNEFGSLSATVPASTGLPTALQDYTVVVVDAAGNEGAPSSAFRISFGYLDCDFSRADATHRSFNANSPHPAWANLNCSNCHNAVTTTTATPVGALLAVPAGTSFPSAPTTSYWCRRP
jgi:Regulator of chromosome condensation (RCC1) repeat